LYLRVNEYSWSSDRVLAAACLLLAGIYACGYAWANLRRKSDVEGIAQINTVAAFLLYSS